MRLTLGSPDSPRLWGRTRVDQVPRDSVLPPRRTTGWRSKVSLRLCRLVPRGPQIGRAGLGALRAGVAPGQQPNFGYLVAQPAAPASQGIARAAIPWGI